MFTSTHQEDSEFYQAIIDKITTELIKLIIADRLKHQELKIDDGKTPGYDLNSLDLSNTKFLAREQLTGEDLSGADLRGADLDGAYIKKMEIKHTLTKQTFQITSLVCTTPLGEIFSPG